MATSTGNDYWAGASTTKKLTVNSKANRTISLTTTAPTTLTWDQTGKSVTAAPSINDTGDVKTYRSDDPDVCTVDSSGNLTFKKAGHCVLTAEVSEGPNYNKAVSNSLTFTVQHVNRSLEMAANSNSPTWVASSKSLTWAASPPGATVTGTATADDLADGSTKRYSTSDSSVCTVNAISGEITFLTVGDCRVVGTISQGAKYNSATSETLTVRMNHGSRTLTMNAPSSSSLTWAATPPTATVSASASEDDVDDSSSKRYTTTDSEICTVDSITGLVSFLTAGDCRVHASIQQGARFNGANSGTPATISMSRATRALNISSHSSYLWSDDAPVVAATATYDDSDAKTFSSVSNSDNPDTSVCTVNSSGQVTFVAPGTCRIKATVQQGPRYNSANNTTVFTVLKRDQSLTFADQTLSLSSGTHNLSSSTNALSFNTGVSGSASYSLVSLSDDPNSANCSISSRTLSFTSTGSCKVKVEWSGNSHWNAADKTVTFTITGTTPTPGPAPAPTTAPTTTPTTEPSPSASPTITRPGRNNPNAALNRPSPTATPSPSAAPAPTVIRPSGNLPTPQSPTVDVPTVVNNNQNSSGMNTNTVNIDGRVVPASQAPVDAAVATRSITALANESMGGFAPGSGLTIEAIGARTTGQFIVTPGIKADPISISAALLESSARSATEFAKIEKASAVLNPPIDQIIGGPVTADALEVFKSSKLDNPRTVGQLDLTTDSRWMKVDAAVNTYKPGTVVYLAVTTQPIIFGAAMVNRDGTAEFSGYLPVDALAGGGHNIRIVGIRELGGVTTDASGEIQLSESTLTEIQRFDEGTKSTVKILGSNTLGGINLVVREIPLDKYKPWWTLILAGWTALVLLVARYGRKVLSKKDKKIASGIMVAGTLPALILGWTTWTYEIMGYGALIGLLGIVLVNFFPVKKEKNPRYKTNSVPVTP